MILSYLGAGQFFGEAGLFDEGSKTFCLGENQKRLVKLRKFPIKNIVS